MRPDLWRPWTTAEPVQASGSGVVIDGNIVLTNAHVVEYATQILIEPEAVHQKFEAEIVGLAPGLDLAALRIVGGEAPDWRPVRLAAATPQPGAEVEVLGYPLGGSLSVTRGVLSRVEYEQGQVREGMLRLQIDAAVNFGNSGGPVFSGDAVLGLVYSMQRAQHAENIGYAVAVEEIAAFLQDIADGKYNGKPQFTMAWQRLENPALRASIGLPDEMTGVLCLSEPAMLADYPLRPGDVLLAIGGFSLSNQAETVIGGHRVAFPCAIERTPDPVSLRVWRDGQEVTLTAPAQALRPLVMPRLNGGRLPYFILGPLAFTIAVDDHVQQLLSRGERWATYLQATGSPLLSRRLSHVNFKGEELVMVPAQPFSHRTARGYDFWPPVTVHSVNGVVIRNLRHLIETLRDDKSEFIQIEFAERWSDRLVFRRDEAIAATTEVLDANGIRRQCSDDLKDLWPELGQ